jgi:hypothetical protein
MTAEITHDPKNRGLEDGLAHLQNTLGRDGWRVYRRRDKVRARWRWFSVTLKYQPDHADGPWRARMRDGVPVIVRRSDDPLEALRPVVAYARESAQFCAGLGLFRNPSKSYLGHRLLQAVRPADLPATKKTVKTGS